MEAESSESSVWDLPDEMIAEVVSRCLAVGLTCALPLSMTCTRLRNAIWPHYRDNYNNWAFMDECARLGYVDLLRYGVDNGALLDLTMLEEFLDGEVSGPGELHPMGRYLFDKLKVRNLCDVTKGFYAEIAARQGNAAALDLLEYI